MERPSDSGPRRVSEVRVSRMRPPTIAITADLADEMLAEARRFAPLETGGLLLGDLKGLWGAPLVTDLIAAGPGAQRERHRFVPDGPWQRRRIAERYEASGRTLDYLGDWHSHPHGNGPSRLDRKTARRIADEPMARCRQPMFLIVTRVEAGWELRGYRFGSRRFRRIPLSVDSESAV